MHNRRSSSHGSPESDDGDGIGRGDIPPELLSDPDSNFSPVGDLWVHWKEAHSAITSPKFAKSQQQAWQRRRQWGAAAGGGPEEDSEATAVLLIHSGGGGAFAWRNVMPDLAASCGVRVVAFDRPGFGLTSRPHPPPAGSSRPNPYSPAAQAALVLQLCGALGIRRVLLVAHGDGCLVAIMAAALARK